MSKFTYCVKFDLEMINDKPIITCTCKKTYEINLSLFNRCKNTFSCPHCGIGWHFERDNKLNTILLIHPYTNGSISLIKKDNKWIINNDYYEG